MYEHRLIPSSFTRKHAIRRVLEYSKTNIGFTQGVNGKQNTTYNNNLCSLFDFGERTKTSNK